MVDAYLRRSPLAHRGLPARALEGAARRAEAGVVLSERPHRCQVNLRGKAADQAFLARVLSAIGLNLPMVANTTTSDGGITAIWLGPDEWLITARPGREAEIAGKLQDAVAGLFAAVTDVSEARTVIAVAGPRARDLMAKATSLDLHPRVFRAGLCAQTGFARATMILLQTADDGAAGGPAYEIFIADSFADYAWQWLEAAGADYGIAVGEC
jgi:sarcosine oxidase subunit gamma